MIFTQTSTEYWSRGASLLHTDPAGERDLALDPNVRTPDAYYQPLRLDFGPRWYDQGIADKVTEAALGLRHDRFLLEEDVVRVIQDAAKRPLWDDNR